MNATKIFFYEYEQLQNKERELAKTIKELHEQIYSITSAPIGERVKNSSGSGSYFENLYTRIDAIERKAIDIKYQRITKYMDISEMLEEIPAPYCEIINRRYIKHDLWEDIAYRIGYSEAYTRAQLHTKALELFGAQLTKRQSACANTNANK